jgi:hypothetical protein
MARAGVRPDLAERVMGHAIAGVEGVYDRHGYTDEKTKALASLAGLIEQIINPTPRTSYLSRGADRSGFDLKLFDPLLNVGLRHPNVASCSFDRKVPRVHPIACRCCGHDREDHSDN